MNPHQIERHPYHWYRERPPWLAPGEDAAEHAASIYANTALMLSPTPEIWGQLLRGNAVPVDQLDRSFLDRARARRVL